jgi:hypothetical protein
LARTQEHLLVARKVAATTSAAATAGLAANGGRADHDWLDESDEGRE